MASTAPVLAVLVCHDGEVWLPEVLAALRDLERRPRWTVAVDTGSADGTPTLLAASNAVDVVLTLPRGTGFAAAVAAGVGDADRRFGRSSPPEEGLPGADDAPLARDPRNGTGDWLWVLHDDAAPAPDCLDVLLSVAELAPTAAVLGPLQLDWDDPRLVVEAGLSTDSSGHRQTGIGSSELDLGQFATNSEVLAVGSAGALLRRREWDALGGFDTDLGLLREDVDLGWRVNRAGGLVLCVPKARVRHARAVTTGARGIDADRTDPRLRATDRAHGLRTLLVNASTPSYALARLRLPVLAVLRALGFLLQRDTRAAGAELAALRLARAAPTSVAAARRARSAGAGALPRDLRGLLTSRTTRLRNRVRGGLTAVVRRRLSEELDLGRLPEWAARPTGSTAGAEAPDRAPHGDGRGGDGRGGDGRGGDGRGGDGRGGDGRGGDGRTGVFVDPGALPAGVLPLRGGVGGRSIRRTAGLRRPGESVGVALAPPADTDPDAHEGAGAGERAGADEGAGTTTLARPRAPAEGDDASVAPDAETETTAIPTGAAGQLVVVPVTVGRVARELLLAPPVLLVAGLTVLSLVVHRARLGLDLAGGRLLRVPGFGALWATYLAEWHSVSGGTAAPAPPALAVLGVLGAVAAPLGGPPAAAAILLLGALPLAGLSAYLASRRLRVGRAVRALAAGVYALIGTTGAAVAQGRLDGVVAAVLLPLVLAGVVAVLRGGVDERRRGSWWTTAAGTVLALGVVSAFAPSVHVLVLVVVLLGFVLVPAPEGGAGRRAIALALVVVLPVLELLPWPAVLVRAPAVLLHGTGAPVPERFADALSVISLDPGGAGSLPVVGLVLVVAAVGTALIVPRRAAFPGLAVLVLGVLAAGVVGSFALPPLSGGDARPGWTGPALAFAACGALWSLLAQLEAARTAARGTLLGRRARRSRAPVRRGESVLDLGGDGVFSRVSTAARATVTRAEAGLGGLVARVRRRPVEGARRRTRSRAVGVLAVAVVALAVLAVLAGGRGPLSAAPRPALDPALAAELAATGARVVEVVPAPTGPGADPDRTRRGGPDLPLYGDDDLAPVGAAPARLQRDVAALLSGDPATTQAAAGELATAGSAVVVLPDAATAARVRAAAGPLLADAPPTSDGRPVVRIALPVAGAVVLEPPISDDATDAKAAPRRPAGITPVPALPPQVAVRVSAGADRRLLVIAAERESGWDATVDGRPVEIVPAWGHLVGVPLPAAGGPVVVDRDDTLRALLLLVQLALVLFTALSALPSRTRLD